MLRILATLILVSTISSSVIVLKPTQQQGEEIAVVLLHGALLGNDQYVPLAKQIQAQITNKRVWVALPQAILDLPLSIVGYKAINDGVAELKSQGFPSNNKIFLAGHSLGGQAVSEYAYEKDNKFSGLILMGASLSRSNRSKQKTTRVLTIGGELDGLMRITRIAEEFYHNSYDKNRKYELVNETPVVVIRGMNHIQFANGDPSSFVKSRDFKAEITLEEAHKNVAAAIGSFINQDAATLSLHLKSTLNLVTPIIQAYELEGSLHFNRPDQNTCTKGFCGAGSDWPKRAQWVLSGMPDLQKEGFVMNVENNFVELDSLPPLKEIHHPTMVHDPLNPKILNITTFSQNSWKLFDKYFDGGFDYTSSNEIGTKMISRQCSFIKGANKSRDDYPFTVDTNVSWCSVINKEALEWGLNHSSTEAQERYNKFGQKMVIAEDTVVSNGFTFTYFLMSMEENKDGDMEVSSRAMMTSIDSPVIPIFAPEGSGCYHYCKLLSPARVIEWIYVESLRKKYGLDK